MDIKKYLIALFIVLATVLLGWFFPAKAQEPFEGKLTFRYTTGKDSFENRIPIKEKVFWIKGDLVKTNWVNRGSDGNDSVVFNFNSDEVILINHDPKKETKEAAVLSLEGIYSTRHVDEWLFKWANYDYAITTRKKEIYGRVARKVQFRNAQGGMGEFWVAEDFLADINKMLAVFKLYGTRPLPDELKGLALRTIWQEEGKPEVFMIEWIPEPMEIPDRKVAFPKGDKLKHTGKSKK